MGSMNYLRAWRLHRNKSQAELAALTGLREMTISVAERSPLSQRRASTIRVLELALRCGRGGLTSPPPEK